MAAPRGRSGPKKDKWKSKSWYDVMAPDMFDRAKVSEALADEPEKLIGRVAEVTVQDITGEFSKMHIKMRFKVIDVRGMEAHTSFVGHNMTSDYVRRMTRRKRSKTDLIVDAYTRDKFLLRIKPLIISERRIKSSQQTAIRQKVHEVINDYTRTRSLNEVIKGVINGQLGRDAAAACKSIMPMQRVEIRRTEVLQEGEIIRVYDDEHAPEASEDTAEEVEVVTEDVEEAEEAEEAPEE